MPTADELAKLRIEEESKKIISQTSRSRKLKQRQLIGEQAEEIVQRKDHVEDAKKEWNVKGTEGQAHGADQIEQNIASTAKSHYEENIKKFSEKGKHETLEAGALPVDLKGRFDKKNMAPSLFSSKTSSKQPKDSKAENNTLYSDGFTKIEK